MMTSVRISVSRACWGRDRRTLRIWRSAAKHALTVLVTWVLMVTSASMYTPRSRAVVTGDTKASLTRTGVGIWCWRRDDAHQRTSVLAGFSCSRFAFIHAETSSMQTDTCCVRLPASEKNKKVSLLSLVCPSPLSDLTISSPNHYDCIVLIVVLYYCVLLFYYCILFLPLFSLMATIF